MEHFWQVVIEQENKRQERLRKALDDMRFEENLARVLQRVEPKARPARAMED